MIDNFKKFRQNSWNCKISQNPANYFNTFEPTWWIWRFPRIWQNFVKFINLVQSKFTSHLKSIEWGCELRKYKWNEDVIIAVVSQFKQSRNEPDSNPWPLRSRCSSLPSEPLRPIQWQAGQFIEFIIPWKERDVEWSELWTAEIQMDHKYKWITSSLHLKSTAQAKVGR